MQLVDEVCAGSVAVMQEEGDVVQSIVSVSSPREAQETKQVHEEWSAIEYTQLVNIIHLYHDLPEH